MSSHTVLDSVALGYQPVWNRGRQLAAVRLDVQVLQPEAVDAEHLLRALGNDWPVAAPTLILALSSPAVVDQLLDSEPMNNTWLEVPGERFTDPDSLIRLMRAAHRGHRLLRRADLAALRGEIIAPIDARSLLRLSPEEALEALRARPTEALPVPQRPSPVLPGQIYEGVASRALAEHCLDEAGAWGLLGWPDEDVLHAWRHRPVGCDMLNLAAVQQAIQGEASLDQVERLVRQDPVLVYRLLLLVNSAAFGLKREIDSLRHALMMLGFTRLGDWLAEQGTGAEDDAALHPVRYGMVMRARLGQHLLDPGADDNLRAEVYLTGLFAQLDRLMHEPLGLLLNRLPLSGRVGDALLRQGGAYRPHVEIAWAMSEANLQHPLAEICKRHEFSLELANRALLRMLSTSRDHRREPARALAI